MYISVYVLSYSLNRRGDNRKGAVLKLSEVLGDLGVQYLLSLEIIIFDSVAANWVFKKLLENFKSI